MYSCNSLHLALPVHLSVGIFIDLHDKPLAMIYGCKSFFTFTRLKLKNTWWKETKLINNRLYWSKRISYMQIVIYSVSCKWHIAVFKYVLSYKLQMITASLLFVPHFNLSNCTWWFEKNTHDMSDGIRYLYKLMFICTQANVLRVTSNQSTIENSALEENGFSIFQSCSKLTSN